MVFFILGTMQGASKPGGSGEYVETGVLSHQDACSQVPSVLGDCQQSHLRSIQALPQGAQGSRKASSPACSMVPGEGSGWF